MRLLYIYILFFSLVQGVFGQWITVKDIKTNSPLVSVVITNRNQSKQLTTDIDGRASLNIFESDVMLYISAANYLPIQRTKEQLLSNDGVFYLEPDNNELSEVVISISKWAQEKEKISQKTVSIKSEDILLGAPQTAADLLQKSGQVFVQKSQLGGGSPMIRGFSTNRLLLTVDGVRMNTAIFRGGNLQNVISIDPFAVAQTEVILGPGSVAYGSDAIGGVMNFYTLKPTLKTKTRKQINTNTLVRYASANLEKTAHFDVNVGFDKWAFLSSFSYTDFDNLRMGSNGPEEYLRTEFATRQDGRDIIISNKNPREQITTGYSQYNFMQKVYLRLNNEWSFDANVLYSTTSDFSRYDRLIRYRRGQLRAAEWFYGPQRWLMGTLQATQSAKKALYDNMKVTTAYQFFEESRNDRDFDDVIRNKTKEKVDAYSLNLDFEKYLGKKGVLFYGAEYILNQVASQGEQLNIESQQSSAAPSRYPDGSTWQSLAAYLSYQHNFNDQFNIQSGVRYNQILLDADFDTTFFDFPFTQATVNTGALTANTGFSWKPTEALQWRLNFSTAFRAPNIDDIGKVFESEPGIIVVPNPELKPEYAYSGELGVLLKPLKTVQLDLSTYYTFLDDALIRRDFSLNDQDTVQFGDELSRVQAIQNAAKSRIYGFEAGLKINFTKAIKFTSQYAITKGEDEEEKGVTNPSRHVAPQFGNTHLVYSFKKLALDAFVEYNGSLSFEELAPSEKNKTHLYAIDANGNPFAPSWHTVNFRARYMVTNSLQSIIALENITDQRYRTYSSGIAAPGRNLIVTLKYML